MNSKTKLCLEISLCWILCIFFSGCLSIKDITYSDIERNETDGRAVVYNLINNQRTNYNNEKRFNTSDELELKSRQGKGYIIEMIATDKKFQIWAIPKEYNKTGRLSFYADSVDGDIHGADHAGEKASNSDPVVKQISAEWKELFKQVK
jgi:hypothetical protein